MAIALIQAMDTAKLQDAFHALAQIEFDLEDFVMEVPLAQLEPLHLSIAVGDHTPATVEFDDD